MGQMDESISANECAAIRYLRADGWTLNSLKSVMMCQQDTIITHAKGGCDHETGPPPVSISASLTPEVIRESRRDAGLTQVALARFLDVDKSTVCHWENGEREPRGVYVEGLLESLPKLRELVDVEVPVDRSAPWGAWRVPVPPMDDEFGDAIRRERKRFGLSQKDVAERVDVDRSTVGNWERGECVPYPETLERLQDAIPSLELTPVTVSTEGGAPALSDGGERRE